MKNSNKGLFVVLSAPSGTGKTTIKNRLLQKDSFEFSVSYTTRELRSGEKDGKDYHFVSRDIFEKKIIAGEFLEYAEVHGAYYGTCIDSLKPLLEGINVLLDIDVQGYLQVKKKYENALGIFIFPPSLLELRSRLESRGLNTATDIETRLKNAKEEILNWDRYDYAVLNDEVENTTKTIHGIVLAEQSSVKRKRWEINTDAFNKS
ncbi:guanylate kinase [PVC group bacterium (ex Bugula neritina AB1)]|nr:guanylate kinase [PVC group bacterium (ex Bugula neritina AB1)]